MGQKKVKFIDDAKKEEKQRPIAKSGKQQGRLTDMGAEMIKEAKEIKQKTKTVDEKVEKTERVKIKHPRGKRYKAVSKKVKKNKLYTLSEAAQLVKRVSFVKFRGSIDAHLTLKEKGLKGEVDFPHAFGKKKVVRIADDKLIEELEAGKTDFDLLIASPQMMSNLVKYAKILGPKGLMPNPKNKTISSEPEKLAKKLESQTGLKRFKTESKALLIHLSIGKQEMSEKQLIENVKALIKAVEKKNIEKLTLAPTMGPGVKVDPTSC